MLDQVLGDALKSVLLEHRGFAWFLYCSEALAFFAVGLFNDAPLLALLGLYPVYQLARYEGERRAPDAPTSEAESEDVLCPHCKFEQWNGYSVCQKCGRPMKSQPK